MKRDILFIFKNLYRNKTSYIVNASLLQLIVLAISSTYLAFLFRLMLVFSGHTQLTNKNWSDIFFHPASAAILILFILSVAFVMYIEFSLLIFMIYGGFENTGYSVKTIIKNAFINVRKLFGPQMLFFILYFILMIPVANLGLSSILTNNLYIPKFITEELAKTDKGLILYLSVMIVFVILSFKLIFTLPLTILNRDSLSKNIKKSWMITKQNKIKLITQVVIFQIILFAISTIIIAIVTFAFTLIDPDGHHFILSSIFFITLKSLLFFSLIFGKLSIISILVYHLRQQKLIKTDAILSNDTKSNKKSKLFKLFIALAVLFFAIYNAALLYNNSINHNVLIVGHRGFVEKGVENSIPALKGAADAKSDYMELDTLLTKDNKFVVIHDNDLNRLADINDKVENLTYNQVIGKTIKQDGHTATIRSLDDFVHEAQKLNIKLLIELKPHGSEPKNYPQRVIDKLKSLNIEKDIRLMSLDYDVMSEIKKRAPEINSGYIIPLQFGDFKETTLDFFVIEDFSYTPALVNQAHLEKKEVFVWTINDEEGLTKYLQTPVDGIITDRPDIANEIKKQKDNENYLERISRILYN